MTNPVQLIPTAESPASAAPVSAAGPAFAALLLALTPLAGPAAARVAPVAAPVSATTGTDAVVSQPGLPGPKAAIPANAVAAIPNEGAGDAVPVPTSGMNSDVRTRTGNASSKLAGLPDRITHRPNVDTRHMPDDTLVPAPPVALPVPLQALAAIAPPLTPIMATGGNQLHTADAVKTVPITTGEEIVATPALTASSVLPVAFEQALSAMPLAPLPATLSTQEVPAPAQKLSVDGLTGAQPSVAIPSLPVALPSPGPTIHSPAESTGFPAPGAIARQIMPALIQVGHGASGSAVTLQLDPAGLGHVQVRIDRDAGGSPTIQVTAERPETLRLLVADQPLLHSALDNAGLAADTRSLSFALATSGGASFSGADGGSAGSRPGYGRSPRNAAVPHGADEETSSSKQPIWHRVGVDITA